LELFIEPRGYKKYNLIIHSFSSDIATLFKKRNTNTVKKIVGKYMAILCGNTENLTLGTHYCKDFSKSLNKLLSMWVQEKIQADLIISKFSRLYQKAIHYDRQISGLIHREISNWICSLPSQIYIEEARTELQKITIRNEELFPGLLLNDKASRFISNQVLSERNYKVISEAFGDLIKETGGKVTWENTSQPGWHYARLPFNYHINLNKVAWTLLQSSVKIVPIIVLLVRLELPGYAEAVGVIEAVRAVVKHINRLHEEKGEVCVYRAIATARKKLGAYPSLKKIEGEIKKLGCSFQKCKFFSTFGKIVKRNKCSLKMKNLEAIVFFLKDKEVLKQMAVDEWWISF